MQEKQEYQPECNTIWNRATISKQHFAFHYQTSTTNSIINQHNQPASATSINQRIISRAHSQFWDRSRKMMKMHSGTVLGTKIKTSRLPLNFLGLLSHRDNTSAVSVWSNWIPSGVLQYCREALQMRSGIFSNLSTRKFSEIGFF